MNVVLRKAAYDIAAGGFSPEICAAASQKLLEAGFRKVDYVECRDAADLTPVERVGEAPARIFGAAQKPAYEMCMTSVHRAYDICVPAAADVRP